MDFLSIAVSMTENFLVFHFRKQGSKLVAWYLTAASPSGTAQIKWTLSGDGIFHQDCWNLLIKTSRMRSKKNAPLVLSADEKKLVKEASQTAEYHDSLDKES